MYWIKRTLFLFALGISTYAGSWGFYGHKLIVEWSIYGLPEDMFSFYYKHKAYLEEYSVLPDVLKNSEEGEYCRHYIDLEHYDTLIHLNFNVDSCMRLKSCCNKGVLPFILKDEYNKLVKAFQDQNVKSILRQSGVLSHYCSDLCVPLHTTENYNGQFTGQKGVHPLWESYLLEKFNFQYDLYRIFAHSEFNLERRVLLELYQSHALVKPLLKSHKHCQNNWGDHTYGFFKRKNKIIKGYSEDFQWCFHTKISAQIEGQLRRSIQLTTDLWFSAWKMAGKPDLNQLVVLDFVKNSMINQRNSSQNFDKRQHE